MGFKIGIVSYGSEIEPTSDNLNIHSCMEWNGMEWNSMEWYESHPSTFFQASADNLQRDDKDKDKDKVTPSSRLLKLIIPLLLLLSFFLLVNKYKYFPSFPFLSSEQTKCAGQSAFAALHTHPCAPLTAHNTASLPSKSLKRGRPRHP